MPPPQAGKFLEKFKRDVLPRDAQMVCTRWTAEGKKCRQLQHLSLGAFDAFITKEYHRHWHDKGRVYLNGTSFSEPKRKATRQEEKKVANLRPGLCTEAKEIQAYLNNLPPNLFSRAVSDHFAKACDVASQLPRSGKMSAELARRVQLGILKAIESQPKPFYHATEEENTVRLFAAQSIPNLKGSIRRVLTSDWHEADLKSCQMAICARLWGIPELEDFLASRGSFWNFVCDQLAIPVQQREGFIPFVKTAVYSICFGKERPHVQGALTRGCGERDRSLQFVQIPLIRTLFEAREKALLEIEKKGGMATPFGKACEVSEERLPRQIMAEVAQAWEMKLIYPAFELARTAPDFTITLYQFDGISVHFKRREESWKRHIEQCVLKEAMKHGFNTFTEWKE